MSTAARRVPSEEVEVSISMVSPGTPMIRLMKSWLISPGGLSTMMSPRDGAWRWYESLSAKRRSPLVSVGTMLMPSTRTVWSASETTT